MSWIKGGRGSKYKWDIFVYSDYMIEDVEVVRDV